MPQIIYLEHTSGHYADPMLIHERKRFEIRQFFMFCPVDVFPSLQNFLSSPSGRAELLRTHITGPFLSAFSGVTRCYTLLTNFLTNFFDEFFDEFFLTNFLTNFDFLEDFF